MRLIYLAAYIVFVALFLPLAVLPAGVSRAIGRALGLCGYCLFSSRRAIAVSNLMGAIGRGALPPGLSAEHVAGKMFGNLGLQAADLVKLGFGLGRGIARDVAVEGKEHYEAAVRRGRGVIVCAAHTGSWEFLPATLAMKLGPFMAVAKKQKNPYIDRFIIRLRQRFGSRIVYKEGALRQFLSFLSEGGTVGVMIDQAVLPKEGIQVDFLGAPTITTKMPCALARRTGAALLPVFIRYEQGRHVIEVHPEVQLSDDDAVTMRELTAHLEEFIRRSPDQWLWLHRRWKHFDTPSAHN